MFCKAKISAIVHHSDEGSPEFVALVRSLLRQQRVNLEVIVADSSSRAAEPPATAADAGRFHVVRGPFASHAAEINAAAAKASGQLLLLIDNRGAGVVLRRSAAELMAMALTREAGTVMVYADYEAAADGKVKEVRLLDHHAGRLRDFQDFGRVWMVDAKAFREIGGLDESLNAGDLYDLRLRLSERGGLRRIANRYAGNLYTVAAAGEGFDVFNYLLASKETQLEMERVLTAHLKRIGAHLRPGQYQRRVTYTPKELEAFNTCLVSVVVPVNNRPEFIGAAIESIQAQTERRVEAIVVVNGGERDPTCEAVRAHMVGGAKFDPSKPPVRLIITDINNIGLCLNTGIAEARGKYYLQLDSDDRLKPNAAEKVIQAFEADPKAGMVIGSYEVWQQDAATGAITRREDIPVVTHDEWTAENGRNNLLRINGAGAPRAIHRKVLREVGWFGCNDEHGSRNYGEDYDLVLRVSEIHSIARIWEPIYEVIRHAGGTDHAIDQATIDCNDETKDSMRAAAVVRRNRINVAAKKAEVLARAAKPAAKPKPAARKAAKKARAKKPAAKKPVKKAKKETAAKKGPSRKATSKRRAKRGGRKKR
jgi:glycosyltransferase involved in cell wall biosynthesis